MRQRRYYRNPGADIRQPQLAQAAVKPRRGGTGRSHASLSRDSDLGDIRRVEAHRSPHSVLGPHRNRARFSIC